MGVFFTGTNGLGLVGFMVGFTGSATFFSLAPLDLGAVFFGLVGAVFTVSTGALLSSSPGTD